MLEETKIFRRATLASIITSTYPMIVVGCYFGITPWNMKRLSIDETDLSFSILIFGIFFVLSNQIAGRILVPKYGTRLVMSLAYPLITFSSLLSITSSSYLYFLLTFIPAGIGWGASGPIGGIHCQLIEKYFKKIITPYYAMGFNIGILVGGGLAGIIMDWSTLWLSKDLNAPLYLASMGLIFFSIGGIFANLFSNTLINLFTEKFVGCHFVMIGASIMFLSLLTDSFYIILIVLSIYGFAVANLIPIVIRQAVKQSNDSIPMTVTNLTTIGLSSTMIMPAAIGFLAETFSLTLNMYLLCIIVFTSGAIFLVKYK